MITKDTEIFDGKSLSDIFKDIYDNSKDKKTKIDSILDSVKNVLKDVSSASLLLPMIKEILEVSVKNDEQLVKMAIIIQRILDKKDFSEYDPEKILTIEEKRQLLNSASEGLTEEVIDSRIKDLSTMVKKAKSIISIEEKKTIESIKYNEKKD